jgi:hypothetical protein
MSNPWHDLFAKMGAMTTKVFAYWTMSNGARFYFAIPRPDKLRDDAFTSDVEFPFLFSEICSLEIPRSKGKGEFEFKNDLDGIATLLPVHGLHSAVTPDRITITM